MQYPIAMAYLEEIRDDAPPNGRTGKNIENITLEKFALKSLWVCLEIETGKNCCFQKSLCFFETSMGKTTTFKVEKPPKLAAVFPLCVTAPLSISYDILGATNQITVRLS